MPTKGVGEVNPTRREPEQLARPFEARFQEQGFAHVTSVFDRQEMEELRKAAERLLQGTTLVVPTTS